MLLIKFLGFTVSGRVQLTLLSQTEVLLKVTSLDGEFDHPILEERRESRTTTAAPEGTMSSQEERLPPPAQNIPAIRQYPGHDFSGPLEAELGLESREDYRRLQDYLASFHQSPLAVSTTLFASFQINRSLDSQVGRMCFRSV